MAANDDWLALARQIARQTSAGFPAPLSDSEITPATIRHAITPLDQPTVPREQLAELVATLQSDALERLDPSPREAFGLARVAHDLAHSRADGPARADTALTLAIVLNRLGEFRDALALCRSAVEGLTQRGEHERTARALCEAAWAETFLGHLRAAQQDVARAQQVDSSASIRARGDWITARVLRDQGNYAESAALLEKARTVFEDAGISLDAARCARELAHTGLRSERAEAMTLLQRARQVFEAVHCDLDVALCDFFTALLGQHQERYAEAIQSFARLRLWLLALGAPFYAAWCDDQLGINYFLLNRFDESLQACRHARDYFLAHAVPVEVSACDINLGNAFYSLNRYEEALTYYQEAADLALAEQREVRAAVIYENMALVYARQGWFTQSLDMGQRALQIYTSHNLPTRIANALVNLAMACRQLGLSTQAIEHLRRARDRFAESRLPIYLAECELALADVLFARGETREATVYLRQARDVFAANSQASFVAVCDRLLAQIAGAEGARARALSLVTQSRAALLEHNQPVDAALCDLTEGELYLEWNESAPAQEAFVRARATLAPGLPDFAWRADFGLGRCAWETGERVPALEHYLAAVRTIAQSRSTLGTEELSDAYFASRQPIYNTALDAAIQIGAGDAALEMIEASKARTFLTLLQNRGWKLRPDRGDRYVADLSAREKELRYKLDALRARATVQAPPSVGEPLRGAAQVETSAAELQELGALSAAYESVVSRLRLAASGLAGVSSPAPFVLDAFCQSANAEFGSDWAALDYYLAGDDLTIAVVQPRQVQVERRKLSPYDHAVLDKCVTTERDLRELIYRGTLRGEPAAPIGGDYMRRLHDLLIPKGLDAGTLLIAPHGSLHALPFHALRNRSGYLIERHTVIYTPSLQALQSLLGAAFTNTPAQSLVLGLSQFGEGTDALPAAAAEVEAVRSVLAGAIRILWEDQATRQQLLALNSAGELQKFDLLHFATHAILDPYAPHQSRVLLRDHALTTLDILDLTLNARLVTLSACQTALGQGGRGDEFVGLARAFFYAGARALLATLWRVEDQPMADVMGQFYRHWARGANAAAALRQAQMEMVRAGSPPYHWAPLVLIGRP